ncbi:MAG: YdbL family protein [bacterium]|nr:YdbL family protein [bacterium]
MKTTMTLNMGVAGVVALMLYTACSPEVKIVGDKDKPIPINAEIKIHIYQHAASVVDDVLRGRETAEQPDMEDEGAWQLEQAATRLVELLSARPAYAATSGRQSAAWQAALARLKEADRKAAPLLKSYMLGENRDGFVSVINKGGLATTQQLAEAAKIADELNAARKAFYEIDAREQGVDMRTVQETYAKLFREKSKGVWVEVQENGTWVWKKN